ncbi:MAG TPA: response regulator transcription factor [Acidimicrobiia bacterium]|nr:response regulator transcription factor [Acidimicrobiia bacterium]
MFNRAEVAERVLVVEDETALVESIRFTLESEGYEVLTAADGVDGLRQARDKNPSLVLLDLMLPGISGLDVCRQIRQESDVPIVMVTAKDGEADKVLGLELGADDYITKPFSTRELLARVRAHLRRAGRTGTFATANEVLRGGRIELDIDAHEARVDGTAVALRPKEFELLEALMRRKNRLATRDVLIDDVWGPSYFGDTKTLDVHVKRLRTKLEADPSKPAQILTVRGLGYKFVDGN